MKRSLLLILFTIFSMLTADVSFAQTDTILTRIVYTNSDRLAILAKTVGVNKVDTLFQTATDARGNTVTVKNLAILASTKDGKSLLIGAKMIYNTTVQSVDSLWAIARIDSPFANIGGKINTVAGTIGGAKILKHFGFDEVQSILDFSADKMMPLGELTPDEQQWYVTLNKSAPGNGAQWFFHGNLSGAGTTDSVLVSQVNSAAAALDDYHMSNLAVSDNGSIMLAMVFDQILTNSPRLQLFQWTPGAPAGTVGFQADVITSLPNFRPFGNTDTCFGFLFRVIPNQPNPTAEIALAPNVKGDLTLYSFRYDGGGSIQLNPNASRTIPRSILGDNLTGLHFFTGVTGTPKLPDDGKEVITPYQGAPNGNGGDMMFSPDGNSVVFVTCGNNDYASPSSSEIGIYDINQAKFTLVQNDLLAMERQPIFTANVVHKFIPPPPPPYQVGKAIIDMPSIDFGSNFIGDPSATAKVKLTDTTSSLVIVTQGFISGPAGSIFTVTSSPSVPATISGHGLVTFTVNFTPLAAQTYLDTLVIHYKDSLQKAADDSIFVIPLTGIGVKKSTGGVQSSSPSSFDLSIAPNPFTSSTKITVTAREAGMASLEIRDLLGKDIYSSKALILGAGEKFAYSLDANTLHLVPGAYFVIVRSGADEITRQVIYVK